MNLQEIKKILKDYSLLIVFIGSILTILNQTGFNINIPQFYNSLNVESKILFMALLNFIITVLAMVFILNKIGKRSKND
jgi:Ni,Fe-hydrogenase I cytochrome b subunit